MLCHVSLHVFIGHWFIFFEEVSLQTVLYFILVVFSFFFLWSCESSLFWILALHQVNTCGSDILKDTSL